MIFMKNHDFHEKSWFSWKSSARHGHQWTLKLRAYERSTHGHQWTLKHTRSKSTRRAHTLSTTISCILYCNFVCPSVRMYVCHQIFNFFPVVFLSLKPCGNALESRAVRFWVYIAVWNFFHLREIQLSKSWSRKVNSAESYDFSKEKAVHVSDHNLCLPHEFRLIFGKNFRFLIDLRRKSFIFVLYDFSHRIILTSWFCTELHWARGK